MSDELLKRIRSCKLCKAHLPLPPRPILNFSPKARILITGQAPGIKAHDSNTPWNDASGDRLREWLGISKEDFYNPEKVAIVPMGFCYPGKGKSGDLPPRPECAKKWMTEILQHLPNIDLHLLIGNYAIQYFLPSANAGLTEIVQNWQEFYPRFIPLPHPSPRNNLWLRKNPWFEKDVVPEARLLVQKALSRYPK
ncbi:uracil-DNA glycosylase family protein [Bdellovibrio bacteriovorus]|uniref:uracil-DNA glycosylase family protein n=1 Tax=Bdellovibrio bacteriovorus TaxID=959 RepID=UPI0021D27DDE|nr:uracil-DNA glycosylase family protein [Bdellovibrio bacteriovorus]UXR64169.1 uracil-DNA glycosylase family protein [Bdellovibrio bacteriovorus]